jgi:hypothetical protein
MPTMIEIENIEQMRQREGIDDVELRRDIRGLGAGDIIRLTLLGGANRCETVAVRITAVRRGVFNGELATTPTGAGLSDLHAGTALTFTAAHIHSLAKGPPGAKR